MIAATCANLAALLLQAHGGEAYTLHGACAAITIKAKPAKPVTINAAGATVRGLTITGGNIRWRGGAFRAPSGSKATGPAGYGVLLRGAVNVHFDGVLVTDAKKGMVLDGGSDVTIADSRFVGVGEDGIIASLTVRVQILRNRFSGTIGKPTTCAAAGRIVLGLSQRVCLAQGGAWTDGFHADAVQLRNGMEDVLVEGNTVEGETQGLSQMDGPRDLPIRRLTIRGNVVRTDGYHRITAYNCIDCLIIGNVVARAPGSTKKAVILPGTARECGNTVQDGRSPRC